MIRRGYVSVNFSLAGELSGNGGVGTAGLAGVCNKATSGVMCCAFLGFGLDWGPLIPGLDRSFMSNFDIETPDSQAAAEEAEAKAIIDRAMLRPNPRAYLATLFRISPGAGQAKRDRLLALVEQRIKETGRSYPKEPINGGSKHD